MQIEVVGRRALRARPNERACARLHRVRFALQRVDIEDEGMILQPVADPQVSDRRDTQLLQMLGGADAGSHEDGGAAKRPRGQDDPARRKNLAIHELYADGALASDDDIVYFGASPNFEVRASADRGSEISDPRIDAHTVDDVERIWANAMRGCAVEIRYMRQANSFRSLDKGTHRQGIFRRGALPDRERAAAAVPDVIAGRRVLHGFVGGKHFLPGPSLDPAFGTTREIGRAVPQAPGAMH